MSMTPEDIRKLFAQQCDFVLSTNIPTQFPDAEAEIAVIGRSNVGKSSLINAVTGRKDLARASKTPGRTQQAVFFNLADQFMLVDLPGYGHAKAPPAERDRWRSLVHTYLRKRESLKSVCLLINGMHGVKANDIEMMDFLDRVPIVYKVVLTKMDQLSALEAAVRVQETEAVVAQHGAALGGIIATSAEDKTGIDLLREFIAEAASK